MRMNDTTELRLQPDRSAGGRARRAGRLEEGTGGKDTARAMRLRVDREIEELR